ncbi:MAG TPA: restriction endonuclease [Blastocatellia bacterium]|nr:restriction endonuclease [Blastocatellia bacterium]
MIKKKSVKRPVSKKPSKAKSRKKNLQGKESVEKGRLFEDAVADLYRLLGAQVTQNIEIHQKKVDILAAFRVPGSSREYRVIVECKNEKRPVDANQRVQAFKGLVDVARIAGTADAAEIVTRVPWSDQAKGFAKSAGIELFTYAEKVSQLIDLTTYLKHLVDRFEKSDPGRPGQPPIGAYYIDPSGERKGENEPEHIPVIDKYIHNWLHDSSTQKQLAVFGEYGAGKSSLCQKLAHDLAAAYLNDPSSSRIPILLNLRDFIGKVRIDAFISSFLDQECGVPNPKYSLFKAMNEAGVFLLILDGLDEMAVKVDADTLESNLMEIDKLAACQNAKAILTSRPEYFISTQEEKEALSPALNVFRTREAEYEPLRILPWDEERINSFLEKRVSLMKEVKQPWTFYRDRIKSIPNLSDLSQRPVLLEMIVKTLPRLIEDNIVVNLPNLYKTYLSGEIKRQRISKKRELLLTEETRLGLLKQLAIDIYTNVIPVVTFSDALSRIEQQVNPPKGEQEAYTREFLTNSFLIRKGDQYHFSHKSIMEYLVATHLAQEIESNAPDIFGKVLLQPVICTFLNELEPDTKTLWNWIYSTRNARHTGGDYLGGNAATLLCSISKDVFLETDLSDTDLTSADLSFADLRRTNFRGALLMDVQMIGARYLEKTIAKAYIRDASIVLYYRFYEEQKDIPRKIYLALKKAFHNQADVSSSVEILSHIIMGRLGTIMLRIKDVKSFSELKNFFTDYSDVTVAIFSDEQDQLFKQPPAKELLQQFHSVYKSHD